MICTCGHLDSQHDGRCCECACPAVTDDPSLVPVVIYDVPLVLPPHRAYRPDWSTWEAARMAAMKHVIGPGAVVFDVGAEEGDLTAVFASWGARVHAFEPNPAVWPNIRAIFDGNGLSLDGWWVGFAADLNRGDGWPGSGGWPTCAAGPVIHDHGFAVVHQRPDLPAVTLDRYVAETGAVPDVVTMDVEGAELDVVRGAVGVLFEHGPDLFLSVHPEFIRDEFGEHPDYLLAELAEAGYRWRLIAVDHEHHVHAWKDPDAVPSEPIAWRWHG